MNEDILPEVSADEKKAVRIIGAGLLLSTVLFTALHHCFPQVLRVPSNEGVPYTGYGTMFLLDLIPIACALLCFYHARHRLGLYRAMIFLSGSFVFTGLEESMWILFGRFQILNRIMALLGKPLDAVAGTYYFTRGFFWWLETPLTAFLGWFFIAYACVYAAKLLLPRANIWLQALLGGLMGVSMDLWLDPVQVHEAWRSWIWLSNDPVNVFSIPFSNFLGWFLVIALFAVIFEYLPAMVKKWGVGRGTVYFYLILIGLEFCILGTVVVYGAVGMKIFPVPVNLTLWGL
jgi:hypothetical protein